MNELVMSLSERDQRRFDEISKYIDENIEDYAKRAMTIEQIVALNKAKRNFYKYNQTMRDLKSNNVLVVA
ncbi:hypothetical protein ACWIYZ_07960 [Ursidibacter arcticus]